MPDRRGRRRCTRRRLLIATAIAAATATQPVRAEGRTHRIEMEDAAFVPAQVTVRTGDRVAWDNADIVAHTATSEAGGFDGDLPPGGKGGTVLTRPGTFRYTCRYHPNMTGRIVVEP